MAAEEADRILHVVAVVAKFLVVSRVGSTPTGVLYLEPPAILMAIELSEFEGFITLVPASDFVVTNTLYLGHFFRLRRCDVPVAVP